MGGVILNNWKGIIRETGPLILLMMLIELAGGGLLNSLETVFLYLPAVLAIVPMINALAGNVGAIVGSRISSGLHIGSIRPEPLDPEVRENLEMGFLTGLLAILITAIALYLILPIMGIRMNLSFADWLSIITLSSILVLGTVTPLAAIISLVAFKKGLSPNDFTIPVVSTVGDFMGILSLAISITVVGIA